MECSPEEFEALVGSALDEIPDEIARLVANVVVLVEDEPPPEDPDLLGLYDGVDLTAWGDPNLELPPRISVFRGPLTRMCEDLEELRHEVQVTVVHEVAHHFGIDDDRLHELGYA